MDKSKRKELREKYEQFRPEMGAIAFKCNATGKAYLIVDNNIQATLNSIRFQLKNGSYIPNRNIQNDWNQYGEEGFTTEILETLKYDDDPAKTDYTKELEILKMMWREKLQKTGEVEDLNKKYNAK